MSARDSHVLNRTDAGRNAEVLERRSSPYTGASDASFRVKWQWDKRLPVDLRDAVRMVRAAHAEDVPTKLHEGPDSIGEGGTPKMTTRAEGYLFGSPDASDQTDPDQFVSYFHTPFRATLHHMSRGPERDRKRAAIVSHVTIGSQNGVAAAIEEGVPSWCAYVVAEQAITEFLRRLTDLKVRLPKEPEVA